jgi:hypothetical protein
MSKPTLRAALEEDLKLLVQKNCLAKAHRLVENYSLSLKKTEYQQDASLKQVTKTVLKMQLRGCQEKKKVIINWFFKIQRF